MKRTMAWLGVAVLAACVLPVAAGQNSDEVLTNADIVTLTEAGLPAAVIVAKIAATRTDFETTVEQLVALSQADVDAGVIEAMMEAASTAPSGGAPADAPARTTAQSGGAAPGADPPALAAGTVLAARVVGYWQCQTSHRGSRPPC